MYSSEQEKVELEHEAAKLFMRWYEQQTGQKIRHIWHNQPRKPDVSCLLNDERLDIEIAHIYGSELEAMKLLGRHLDEKTRYELRLLEHVTDPHQRLVSALNRILNNKAGKTYTSNRVWLVLRNVNPGWSRDDIAGLQGEITVPARHPFEQIWIVGDKDGKTGIVQLYPAL
ncbi:hypothetical protein [Parendozoicomonas haliclonae]|uniref:Uncharacterized protein n=1 Tax=Parendozoicomonas haliclonae TaxID=1960125 RepID=A0A1X7AKZ8_9GAMM|nr:hypothetical protein [Parendozoicomonas haliclonae]SMA47699.1 hypothetical protein EHSB41UT_02510 [Parendozoicomonas haliclonae]